MAAHPTLRSPAAHSNEEVREEPIASAPRCYEFGQRARGAAATNALAACLPILFSLQVVGPILKLCGHDLKLIRERSPVLRHLAKVQSAMPEKLDLLAARHVLARRYGSILDPIRPAAPRGYSRAGLREYLGLPPDPQSCASDGTISVPGR
jgi:hypothetical protein